MISMCTLLQLQVGSWKQTGYCEAKNHESKVFLKNRITVVLKFSPYVVMYEKTPNEHCKRTT